MPSMEGVTGGYILHLNSRHVGNIAIKEAVIQHCYCKKRLIVL